MKREEEKLNYLTNYTTSQIKLENRAKKPGGGGGGSQKLFNQWVRKWKGESSHSEGPLVVQKDLSNQEKWKVRLGERSSHRV